ncbi:MAG: UDP-4-amino-4,6-dideoxy-N-acetyl-beta-L-altrosamine transaminase [Piscirickettsiaceae bacterium]|nr:MAG: UDP-4-amino-4,6-dideoxy-N-acetyl-beta-L-altrosamine transaminase [Piscirickettsiaceae bacterium]
MIPYGKQDINQADIDAVIDVLRSDFLTQGSQVPLFEKTVSNYCGVQFGVATNSATSALHIACLALGLGEGDYLWTSPNTFVASVNCALYCGAKVDFIDIDLHTYNMCANKLEEKLKVAKQTHKLPKIVIPVHFAGQSCNMKRIHELGQEYGFKIIEDAAQAIGGKYLERPIGSCQYSDITVFSFHPVKIITTAEGGLATTNSEYLSVKMGLFRSHGVTREPQLMVKELEGGWHYQQIELGFNYRMTELQAALGVSQMQRLDEFIMRRHVLQAKYDKEFEDLPIIVPHQNRDCFSALHLYPIQLKLKKINKTRAEVYFELRKNQLGVNVHFIPVHTQPYYQQLGFRLGDFPQSEKYYNCAISIPLHQGLSDKQQNKVIAVLKRVLT